MLLENKDDLKYEDDLKCGDDLKYEDNLPQKLLSKLILWKNYGSEMPYLPTIWTYVQNFVVFFNALLRLLILSIWRIQFKTTPPAYFIDFGPHSTQCPRIKFSQFYEEYKEQKIT